MIDTRSTSRAHRYGVFGATRGNAVFNSPANAPPLDPGQKYTGQHHDAETGFSYYGARYYDAAYGRFLSPDPVVPEPKDPQQLNRYAYVRNDPLNATDPSGHSAESAVSDWGDFDALFQSWVESDRLALQGEAAEQEQWEPDLRSLGEADFTSLDGGTASRAGSGSWPGFAPALFPVDLDPAGIRVMNPSSDKVNCPGCHLGKSYDPHVETHPDAWVAWDTTNKLMAIVPLMGAALRAGTIPSAIATPYGPALQGTSRAALAARTQVAEGATLWRIGTAGKSAAGEAQFWALEHPLSPGFAGRYGVPAQNLKNANFIESATLRPGASFVTRSAPGVGANSGGGVEVVTEPWGVILRSFSHHGF